MCRQRLLTLKTKAMIKFKDLPVEIQQRVLDEQVRQGNKRDAEVFEKDTSAGIGEGGFTWSESGEGHDFWNKVLTYGNFSTFYEKYPKVSKMIGFKDLPEEIREKMLNEQVRQGSPRDSEVFEVDVTAGSPDGGFVWSLSVEGYDFWSEIIVDGDFAVFYEKYPKRPRLKIIPLHIKILNSKGLLEDIAEKLLLKWHDEGRPAKRINVDWFEYGGLYWSANAEMEADYKVTQYSRDTPPESHLRRMSVVLGAIECTDEAGNLVLVDFFDDERTLVNEDDFVRGRIIDMEVEGN